MKYLLNLLLLLTIIISSCESNLELEDHYNTHYIKVKLIDNDSTISVFHKDIKVLSQLKSGDSVWVYTGLNTPRLCHKCTFDYYYFETDYYQGIVQK